MPQLFRNNATGVLAAQLDSGATALTLVDASAFPVPGADFYLVTLAAVNGLGQETAWEIVRVTGKAGNVLTVVRAQEGTADATWPVATPAQMRLTAGSLDGKESAGAASTAVAAHAAAGDPHPQYTTTAEAAAAAPVQSVAGKTGAVSLVKADVGLGNVDNTSDANKPVSTATQTALNAKQATLVSGTNIKTVNGQALTGAGDVVIETGVSLTAEFVFYEQSLR